MSVEFQKLVLTYWKKEGRHSLPWRKTHDAYLILVSEIMLQQTQVDRVIPHFEKWKTRFPTVEKLAKAPLSDVLSLWSGLGYNRRAKLLHECAKEIVAQHKGVVPRDVPALVSLPAIGPYTAGAIRAFAFNEPTVFIETNIRAALIHHFFPKSLRVPDSKLTPILKAALTNVKNPREWYSALMDYGSHIKKMHPNPSRRSKHHVTQSPFIGSLRQARGAILRTLVSGKATEQKLRNKTPPTYYKKALASLLNEKMIEKVGARYQLPQK